MGTRLSAAIHFTLLRRPAGQMSLFVLAVVAVIFFTGCRQVARVPAPSEAAVERVSYADAIGRVAPSIVSIYTFTERQSDPEARTSPNSLGRRLRARGVLREDMGELQGLGSGVVTTRDGHILTSAHLLEEATRVQVVLPGGDEMDANIVGMDHATDLAVIKVRGGRPAAAVLGDSGKLRVGDVVLAFGNSFGVGQTVTSGIISATERSGFGMSEYENFLQTDAPINPGNSGGALADASGRVIGINSAILTSGGGSEGIGFAIPINLARNVMNQLIANGKVVRGYLGAVVNRVSPELAPPAVNKAGGALVVRVEPGSPAATAGIEEGDIVVQANERQVKDSRAFRLQIADTAPGTQVRLKVVRAGVEKTLAAKVAQEQPRLAVGGTR